MVHQLDAPTLLAQDWPVAARQHTGDQGVQCTVAGSAIRRKCWWNHGMPAEVVNTYVDTAVTKE